MRASDPYLAEILELTDERALLYARQCQEPGDRGRLSEINDLLQRRQLQRNCWRIGGDPASVSQPLPELLKDMRVGGNHWKARRHR